MINYSQAESEIVTYTRDMTQRLSSGETITTVSSAFGVPTTTTVAGVGDGTDNILLTTTANPLVIKFPMGIDLFFTNVNGLGWEIVGNLTAIDTIGIPNIYQNRGLYGTSHMIYTTALGLTVQGFGSNVGTNPYSINIYFGNLLTLATPTASSLEYSLKISGGTSGNMYPITNTCTTSSGNTFVDKFNLLIK